MIKQRQAFIAVGEDTEPSAKTLAQLIDYYTRDTSVTSRKTLVNLTRGEGVCRELVEVISREPIVPPEDAAAPVPYVVDTEFFCEVRGHHMATSVRNFEGDKRQLQYQRVGLRMAEGVHVLR